MEFITNPTGQAAVPDGAGGIKFVPHAAVPHGSPWGHFRYQGTDGVQRLARGPKPPANVQGYDWYPDVRAGMPAPTTPPVAPLTPTSAAVSLAAAALSAPAPRNPVLPNAKPKAPSQALVQPPGDPTDPQGWAASRKRVLGRFSLPDKAK